MDDLLGSKGDRHNVNLAPHVLTTLESPPGKRRPAPEAARLRRKQFSKPHLSYSSHNNPNINLINPLTEIINSSDPSQNRTTGRESTLTIMAARQNSFRRPSYLDNPPSNSNPSSSSSSSSPYPPTVPRAPTLSSERNNIAPHLLHNTSSLRSSYNNTSPSMRSFSFSDAVDGNGNGDGRIAASGLKGMEKDAPMTGSSRAPRTTNGPAKRNSVGAAVEEDGSIYFHQACKRCHDRKRKVGESNRSICHCSSV